MRNPTPGGARSADQKKEFERRGRALGSGLAGGGGCRARAGVDPSGARGAGPRGSANTNGCVAFPGTPRGRCGCAVEGLLHGARRHVRRGRAFRRRTTAAPRVRPSCATRSRLRRPQPVETELRPARSPAICRSSEAETRLGGAARLAAVAVAERVADGGDDRGSCQCDEQAMTRSWCVHSFSITGAGATAPLP